MTPARFVGLLALVSFVDWGPYIYIYVCNKVRRSELQTHNIFSNRDEMVHFRQREVNVIFKTPKPAIFSHNMDIRQLNKIHYLNFRSDSIYVNHFALYI